MTAKTALIVFLIAVFAGLCIAVRQVYVLRAEVSEIEADLAKFAGKLTECETQLDAAGRR